MQEKDPSNNERIVLNKLESETTWALMHSASYSLHILQEAFPWNVKEK